MARYFNPNRFDCQMAIAPSGIDENGRLRMFKNEEIQKIFETEVGERLKMELGTVLIPMALRWFLNPKLGFPIAPFRVYRRHIRNGFKKKTIPFLQRSGGTYYFPQDSCYELQLVLKNNALVNASTTLTLLDHRSMPIEGATNTYNFAPNQTITLQFVQPNTKGIQVFGSSSIQLVSIEGTPMTEYLNADGWELTQIVGLPFKEGEPDKNVYGDELQGYINNPTAGNKAAVQRAAIGRAFYKSPNYLQPDGVTLPDWKIPEPVALIDAVKKTVPVTPSVKTGILYDIYEMLQQVIINKPALYQGQQRKYFKQINSKGISDGGGVSSNDGVYQNYVCSTALLGTATDMWLSLALGFGTMEFADLIGEQIARVAAQSRRLQYDYMVSGVFLEPNYKVSRPFPFGPYEVVFDGFKTREYGAIAHLAANGVETPINPTTSNITSARPAVRDGAFVEDTLIEWDKPQSKTPSSYALALRDGLTGDKRYLNQTRIFLKNNYQPFVGADRADGEGTAADFAKFRFVHPQSPIPFAGSAIKDYYIAATDVFGRWSNWAKINRVLTAKPPANAQVIQAQFIVDASDTADHTYPASLEMIIGWDWDDRSPLDIDIAGQFIPIPMGNALISPESLVTTPLIPKNSIGGALSDYSIGFYNTGEPFMTTSITPAPPSVLHISEASVVEDMSDNTGSMTKKYKVRIHGFSLNFENTSQLAFGVYVRAREKTNSLAWTNFTVPTIVITKDPLPRAAPLLPPDIRWTSLPDATNMARYYLSFAPIPQVAGYVVYRATETALRDKLGLPQITQVTTIDGRSVSQTLTIEERTITLRDLPINAKRLAKDAFIRINPKLITQPNLELTLNGDVDGLYIYAISSMTPENQESDFSSWIYVAIPRRFTPRPAALSGFVKTFPMPSQCEIVIDIELPKGTASKKIELFKTTRQGLSSDLDLMGLPIKTANIDSLTPEWEAFDADGKPVTLPNQVISRLRTRDIVPRSWLPNFYRVVTYGEDDRTKGKYPGRSKSSNLLEIAPLTPEAPPSVRDPQLAVFNATMLRLSFKTNAPILSSAFGDHRLSLQKFSPTNQIFETWLPDKIVPQIPKKQAVDVPTIQLMRRTSKTTDGFWEFETFVETADVAQLSLALVDPKGRKTEQKFSYAKPVVITPKIVGAVKVRLLQTFEIRFATNIRNKVYETGAYNLLMTRKNGAIKIVSVDMATIPDDDPLIITGIVSLGKVVVGGEKYFGYVAKFKLSPFSPNTWINEVINITITDPSGQKTSVLLP
jgi:hypothetical protein